jgi:hypothetical protein
MKQGFISFKKEIQTLIQGVVVDPTLHGLWLNTLSYLENCGARKIASCEHPTAVKEEMLKHAAEEFRHAFYLKKQLLRIGCQYEDYRKAYLLGGWAGCHYLNALDLSTSRYLRGLKEELYPLYQAALRASQSKVQVQSILLEEKEHLAEMEEGLNRIPQASQLVERVCQIEAGLFKKWLDACYLEAQTVVKGSMMPPPRQTSPW